MTKGGGLSQQWPGFFQAFRICWECREMPPLEELRDGLRGGGSDICLDPLRIKELRSSWLSFCWAAGVERDSPPSLRNGETSAPHTQGLADDFILRNQAKYVPWLYGQTQLRLCVIKSFLSWYSSRMREDQGIYCFFFLKSNKSIEQQRCIL